MLIRKMLRDMWLNKTQFISIFLMTILGVYIYAGVSSEWNGLKKTSDQFYQDTNLADAWIYSNGFSDEEEEAVAAADGITGVERRFSIDSIGKFDNKPTIKLHFVEKNSISTFRLIDGEEFSLNKSGIWLDSQFAKAKGLKVGDKITVTLQGYDMEKEIKGLVMSPEYVYCAGENDVISFPGSYGYGFLSNQEYPKGFPVIYTELLVTTDRLSDNELENRIDETLDGKYSVFLARKNLRSYMQFTEEIKEHRAMGQLFPIIFLAVALLTTVTTMARLVNNQRTQIGILKAIGFKRRRILFHYISYGLWISLSGSILGAVLGPLTLPYLFYIPMKTTYSLPVWQSAIPPTVILMVVLSIVGSVLATYLACRNVLKDTPSESLRPKAPKYIKHSFIDRLKLWKHLDFHTQWNLRDVFRCKGRSIMAIVGVLGCSALLICSFGMQDTFEYVVDWNYKVINRYETKLELNAAVTAEQIEVVQNAYHGDAIQEGSIEIKANGIKRSGELLITEDTSLIRFVDKNSKRIELPKDQLSISYKLAQLLKIKAGDSVSWHIYGEEKWNTEVVGAIYRTPFTQGITLSRDYYEKEGYPFLPTAVVTNQILSEAPNNKIDGVSRVQSKEMLIDSFHKLAQAMNVLIYVLMIAAVILAVVVIYNLGVLAFTERQRELSTLKVIGFQTKKLRSLLLTQNIWLTVVGIIPGIPIGIYILSYIFGFVGEVFDFIIVIHLTSYLYCILGTLLVSILVNRLFSKRVKKIDMVSSLKGIE